MPIPQLARTPTIAKPPVSAGTVAAGLRAFFRIMDLWDVDNRQAMVLLGHPARSTFFNWKKGRVGGVPYDTIRRISYLLGIYKALQILYSQPRMADAWINKPNEAFGGRSALDRMTGGDVTDVAVVREYLDAVLSGQA